MRDRNLFLKKLGIRMKEIDQLINEMQAMAQNSLSSGENGAGADLDMEKLTIMGHGFGATTAIAFSSKDKRIKSIVTFDPWLSPLGDEILERQIAITQPHCSINSEMFTDNVPDNWKLLDTLFRDAKRKNAGTTKEGSILCTLKGVGHMAFSDLSLILLLELRLIQFTPSFAQVFRGQYNMKLIIDVTRAFFLRNGMSKEGGNYEDLIKRLESTKDLEFEIK